MGIIETLKNKLINSDYKPRIIYAEGWNKNIQQAASFVKQNNTINPILIFHTRSEVPNNFDLDHIIIDEADLSKYSSLLFELRKVKGLTEQQAKDLVKQPNYLASLMVKSKDADGEICGIDYTTKDTLKPALQIIKTAPGAKLVTSAFIMEKDDQLYVFGDCAINIYPTSEELANIAKMIAIFAYDNAQIKDVRVALLSYSTVGSGAGESVDKIRNAFQLIKDDNDLKNKNIQVFGEMQFDAAFSLDVMQKKAKGIN
jgi:phosphate acetyltransferase